jgi:N6-L-threonylcarbamoyladenine synthase
MKKLKKDGKMILGIESTAHTFGVGIVKDGKILANVKASYTTEKGGIIPLEAAKHHLSIKEKVYNEALEKARIDEKQIKGIAFSQGPGLSPCLHQGLNLAKELALKLKIPIVPVR